MIDEPFSASRIGAGAHVFVDDLELPELSGDDRHHLERVLRLRTGAMITISDGLGSWRTAVLGTDLAPLGPLRAEPQRAPELVVAFALVKGDRNELVVQKLTELGIDRIVPMHTDRGVVQWDRERAPRHIDRLRRVAREAAMQCRRARLPLVEPPRSVAEVALLSGAAMADQGGLTLTLDHPVVLIGPEGGWSDAERQIGLPTVGLATHVLRAETAAITAAALLSAARISG